MVQSSVVDMVNVAQLSALVVHMAHVVHMAYVGHMTHAADMVYVDLMINDARVTLTADTTQLVIVVHTCKVDNHLVFHIWEIVDHIFYSY